MKENNYIHARTCVYNVNYHIVWTTKYRRKVLTPKIDEYLQKLLREIGDSKGFEVIQSKVGESDHIHVFVSAHPKVAPSYIAKMLKGISGRRLFIDFPEIKNQLWKNQLWNNSYFIESIGSTSQENIQKYIDRQKNCQM